MLQQMGENNTAATTCLLAHRSIADWEGKNL